MNSNPYGRKTVEVSVGDINKVTHSYIAQYAVTGSGLQFSCACKNQTVNLVQECNFKLMTSHPDLEIFM